MVHYQKVFEVQAQVLRGVNLKINRMELIRELNEKRNQTFVIATHQEGLAQGGKERVIRLANGEAIEE